MSREIYYDGRNKPLGTVHKKAVPKPSPLGKVAREA